MMEPSALQTLWFFLVGFLLAGYTLLDGYDLGVGCLLPFLAEREEEKRTLIRAIGPFWDGNEVWLLAGGGALFSAFPWTPQGNSGGLSSLFSGFSPRPSASWDYPLFSCTARPTSASRPRAPCATGPKRQRSSCGGRKACFSSPVWPCHSDTCPGPGGTSRPGPARPFS